MAVRILLVEDEPDSRRLIALHLEAHGLPCVAIDNGSDAVTMVRESAYDLIILDVMLPGIDGLTVCRTIRRSGSGGNPPILMLTARDGQSDIALGLGSGADDYLTKPFSAQELVARVRALLRRASTTRRDESAPRRIGAHGLELDYARRMVWRHGRPIQTTKLEFQLLYLLASQPGIVFSRRRILQKLGQADLNVTERTVDALVKRLRRKVETPDGGENLIRTVWGEGYKFLDL